MEKFATKWTMVLYISFNILKSVDCISCYVCSGTDSNEPFECNEFLDSDTQLVPKDCEDIHNAQFCIKLVGRFEGTTIDCYQCSSSSDMECGDGLMNLDGGILLPTPCDNVYHAQYCIKQTGGISTKRYCSALDLGNYCNYVRQPGDKLEYRTCAYTCNTDGCNGTSTIKVSIVPLFLVFLISKSFVRLF